MKDSTSPYNDMKIFKHTKKLSDLDKGLISGPIFLRIKPTNKCQHNCFYCDYLSNHAKTQKSNFNINDSIDWDILKQSLIDFKDIGGKSITYSGGGEPLVYHRIENALELTKSLNLDMAIITNGQMLSKKKSDLLQDAKWIRISLDFLNEEMFKKVRRVNGKNFFIIEENIKNFINSKNKHCDVGINCVVHEYNAKYIYSLCEYVKRLGVSHIKFAALICDNTEEYHKSFKKSVTNQINDAIDTLNDNSFKVYDKYSSHFDYSAKMYRTYSKCLIMQIGAVIGADAKIYTCHDKAYDKCGCLGNLKKNTLKEIWFSNENKTLFNTFNPKIICNHHCMYDSRNILLNNYLNVDKKNINFI